MLKKILFGVLVFIAALSFWACDKGYAVAIGLKSVDPNHYGGWTGELDGTVPDAKLMASIAEAEGFNVDVLLTASATRQAVLSKLSALAEKMNKGDLLVVSYSGHGGQIPDQNGDEEDDNSDETWCLYDGELLDDELYQAWSKFKAGVRILVFSDSCNSGTVVRMKGPDYEAHTQEKADEFQKRFELSLQKTFFKPERAREILSRDAAFRSSIRDRSPQVKAKPRVKEVTDEEVQAVKDTATVRIVPWQILMKTYQQNRRFYDDLGKRTPGEATITVDATVILISGCQDGESSIDLGANGLFTITLSQVWDNAHFVGSHTDFHTNIKTKVSGFDERQNPNLFIIGTSDPQFVQQKPYTIK